MAVATSRELGALCNFAGVRIEGVTVHGKGGRRLLEKVGSSFRLAACGTGATPVVILGASFLAAGSLSTSTSFGAGAVVERDWSCRWDGSKRYSWNSIKRYSWNGIKRYSGSGGCIDGGLEKWRAIVKYDVGARHRYAWRYSCWLDRSRWCNDGGIIRDEYGSRFGNNRVHPQW
jgi:hypothetical protein